PLPPHPPLFPYTTLFRSPFPVCRHQLGCHEVVAGQPELPGEAADTATEREACHAGVRDGADGRGEPEREGFAVEFAEERARLDRSEEHTSELQSRFDLVC